LNAFGLHRKKEETLALILEENARKNPEKPLISNRQIYVGSGTVLTSQERGRKNSSSAPPLEARDVSTRPTETAPPGPSDTGTSWQPRSQPFPP